VVIYLSIILAGCVVVSIADSFAAHEVDTRLRISGAVAIFTQVCGPHSLSYLMLVTCL
jgi:acyl-coenzyme A synthetase/AMP-(fatty) acid ligase